jgi:uncharacterized membrane protein
METPARIHKHPLHPMLVMIPVGLWVFSLICDLAYLWGVGNPNWAMVAFYTMMGGVIGAIIAAVPGFIDMFSLPERLQRTAKIHMSINLAVVVLYLINAWMRLSGVWDVLPVWLSALSVTLLMVSGWLGGKMVYEHGVALQGTPDPAPRAGRRLIHH